MAIVLGVLPRTEALPREFAFFSVTDTVVFENGWGFSISLASGDIQMKNRQLPTCRLFAFLRQRFDLRKDFYPTN
jgi:hypothetical protein